MHAEACQSRGARANFQTWLGTPYVAFDPQVASLACHTYTKACRGEQSPPGTRPGPGVRAAARGWPVGGHCPATRAWPALGALGHAACVAAWTDFRALPQGGRPAVTPPFRVASTTAQAIPRGLSAWRQMGGQNRMPAERCRATAAQGRGVCVAVHEGLRRTAHGCELAVICTAQRCSAAKLRGGSIRRRHRRAQHS